MRGRVAILLLAIVVSSVGVVPAARADRTRFADGNDAPGPLDIDRIAHGHRTTAGGVHRLVHTVRLRQAWPVQALKKRGFLLLYFELRGNRDAPPERTLQVEYEKGKLVARMYDTLADPSDHLGRVPLRQPGRRTLRFLLPKSLLRDGLRRYKWNAVTAVEQRAKACGRVGGCVDWAPDSADKIEYVRHVL